MSPCWEGCPHPGSVPLLVESPCWVGCPHPRESPFWGGSPCWEGCPQPGGVPNLRKVPNLGEESVPTQRGVSPTLWGHPNPGGCLHPSGRFPNSGREPHPGRDVLNLWRSPSRQGVPILEGGVPKLSGSSDWGREEPSLRRVPILVAPTWGGQGWLTLEKCREESEREEWGGRQERNGGEGEGGKGEKHKKRT